MQLQVNMLTSTGLSKMAHVAMAPTRILEVNGLNFSWKAAHPKVFHGFPLSWQANAEGP
jgi:hypothetical protein